MSNPNDTGKLQLRLLESIHTQRFVLLGAGIGFCLLGLATMIVPWFVLDSVLWLAGVLWLCSAVIRFAQWIVGRFRGGKDVRGLGPIVLHSSIDVLIGLILIFQRANAAWVTAIVLGIALFADGLIQIWLALRHNNVRHRTLLFTSGFVTGGLAIAAVVFCFLKGEFAQVNLATDILATLIGLKLLVFGGVLVWMASMTHTDPELLTYGFCPRRKVEPVAGEAYAVFIGNAFHLGLYIGDNTIIDFRDDNLVHKVTWEQFLIGRDPVHWEYPDLDDVPFESVRKAALEEVDKTHQYDFLNFNCESFVVWIKSLRKTTVSKYSQIGLTMETVTRYPFLGTVVELYTRITEWLAFHLGGTFGKHVSRNLRRVSSITAVWLLYGSRAKQLEKTDHFPGTVEQSG
ncbi:MAG: HdeD family acid-resistance protein [Gemmataceae bacterium]